MMNLPVLVVCVFIIMQAGYGSTDKWYEINKKQYYCGDTVYDIMKTICPSKKGDPVPDHDSISRKTTSWGIASHCCPLPWKRLGDPSIDGCTIKEMWDHYCAFPDRFRLTGDRVNIKDYMVPLRQFLNKPDTTVTRPFVTPSSTPPSTTTRATTTNTTPRTTTTVKTPPEGHQNPNDLSIYHIPYSLFGLIEF